MGVGVLTSVATELALAEEAQREAFACTDAREMLTAHPDSFHQD
jgi:hypothetical protein